MEMLGAIICIMCIKLLFDGLDPGFREGDPHDYSGRDDQL